MNLVVLVLDIIQSEPGGTTAFVLVVNGYVVFLDILASSTTLRSAAA